MAIAPDAVYQIIDAIGLTVDRWIASLRFATKHPLPIESNLVPLADAKPRGPGRQRRPARVPSGGDTVK
jgi:hypothetical protein